MEKLARAQTTIRNCSVCGCDISVRINLNLTYRGGYYFGKVPKISKAEMSKVIKALTKPVRIGIHILQVINRDPKPYCYFEYWECEGCYNGSVQK